MTGLELCEYFKQLLPSDVDPRLTLVVRSGPSQVMNVSFNANKYVSCISWDKDYPCHSFAGPSKLLM